VHLRSFGEDASVAISLVGRGYEKSGFDLTSYQGVMKSTQYRPRPAAILVLSARARVRARAKSTRWANCIRSGSILIQWSINSVSDTV
jgi:hypothetical protein